MWSQWPDWLWLGGVLLASLIVAQLGYAWFMKTKRGFADVV
jgi:lipopolysaccharide transport system permease protein